MKSADTIRQVFLRLWHEYAVFNTEDVDGNEVIAQGQCSGRFYVLTLDDNLAVIREDIYF